MRLSEKNDLLSHHANLLIGGSTVHDQLIDALENKHHIHIKGNPDFSDLGYETFTIDDARKVKALAETKPAIDSNASKSGTSIGDGKKIFVLSMKGITIEAQNALLKLLEEPSEYAHFFLIVPFSHLLLPTVKSRMLLIHDEKGAGQADLSEAKQFVKASPAQRLDIVKKLMDAVSKEKKTKQDAVEFLQGIETVVYDGGKGLATHADALKAIETARNYMYDRAPSVKMLLEYVAMNI